MPREYKHIKQYEKELFELKSQGLTLQQIGNKFGFISIPHKRTSS